MYTQAARDRLHSAHSQHVAACSLCHLKFVVPKGAPESLACGHVICKSCNAATTGPMKKKDPNFCPVCHRHAPVKHHKDDKGKPPARAVSRSASAAAAGDALPGESPEDAAICTAIFRAAEAAPTICIFHSREAEMPLAYACLDPGATREGDSTLPLVCSKCCEMPEHAMHGHLSVVELSLEAKDDVDRTIANTRHMADVMSSKSAAIEEVILALCGSTSASEMVIGSAVQARLRVTQMRDKAVQEINKQADDMLKRIDAMEATRVASLKQQQQELAAEAKRIQDTITHIHEGMAASGNLSRVRERAAVLSLLHECMEHARSRVTADICCKAEIEVNVVPELRVVGSGVPLYAVTADVSKAVKVAVTGPGRSKSHIHKTGEGVLQEEEMGSLPFDADELMHKLGVTFRDETWTINFTRITPDDAKQLYDVLHGNHTVHTLIVNSAEIGDDCAPWFAKLLTTNTSLRTLNINDNKLGPKGVRILCDALKHNHSLERLNLSGNTLGPEGSICVAEMLEVNTMLGTLYMSHVGMDLASAAKLGEALAKNQSLHTLDLWHNNLGPAGVKHISEGLKQNRTLHTLILNTNELGTEGTRFIADALRTNHTLHALYLSDNGIGGDGALLLAEMLKFNGTLDTLSLTANPVTPEDRERLEQARPANNRLKQLHL